MKRVAKYAALPVAIVLAVGLWLFEPWRLWTSSTVDEAAPTSRPRSPLPTGATSPTASPPPAPPSDVTLASGRFEDAEHTTTGRATILELADGRRFLRLADLSTSDGPDLHMWLSDQPSGGDWGSYDDRRYLRLGKLKATDGNQNYEIPADVELAGMRSVVIWCDRFDVAFGTAPIKV